MSLNCMIHNSLSFQGWNQENPNVILRLLHCLVRLRNIVCSLSNLNYLDFLHINFIGFAHVVADARLRIVSERVDFIDNLIISVTIGPPNSMYIKSKDKSTWTAKDVADSVLSDKSALRVTSSQRLAESSVLDTQSSNIDGEPYWYYEYLVRKSPTKIVGESNIYRHYVASTAERDGFLYSINASTLGAQWNSMGPFLQQTVESFRLLPPTEDYVPPYKDPWRFW
ncbi:PsbP domain-containing protein 5, chloroplastic, partial [Cucurbita argyrosperma subsp. argyrosperma]